MCACLWLHIPRGWFRQTVQHPWLIQTNSVASVADSDKQCSILTLHVITCTTVIHRPPKDFVQYTNYYRLLHREPLKGSKRRFLLMVASSQSAFLLSVKLPEADVGLPGAAFNNIVSAFAQLRRWLEYAVHGVYHCFRKQGQTRPQASSSTYIIECSLHAYYTVLLISESRNMAPEWT